MEKSKQAFHYHLDRPFTRDFMIANVAVVDTDVQNGAMAADA
jgi:hypothetical protein